MRPTEMNTGLKETFRVLDRVYDVSKAKTLIGNIKPKNFLDVKEAKPLFSSVKIDKERAVNPYVDLRVPVILVTISGPDGDLCLPIDGWHRIYKAHKTGVKRLPAHVLDVDQSEEVRKR